MIPYNVLPPVLGMCRKTTFCPVVVFSVFMPALPAGYLPEIFRFPVALNVVDSPRRQTWWAGLSLGVISSPLNRRTMRNPGAAAVQP
jgi:hypothetical protein